MKPLFTPKDFNTNNIVNVSTGEITLTRETAAKLANEKLEEWLAEAPVVYAKKTKAYDSGFTAWSDDVNQLHTHKARLVAIEELASPEPCKHEPPDDTIFIKKTENEDGFITLDEKSLRELFSYYRKCKHCGVELVAEWKEKK